MNAWRLWSVGGAPGWEVTTRRRLLAHLERQGWLARRLVLREEDGAQPFDAARALQPMSGPWPGGLTLQGDDFDVWLDLSWRPALELRCRGGTLETVAHWADGYFAEAPPAFAWLAPFGQAAPAGLEAVLDELQGSTGPGHDVALHGPAGPGLVTWVGPAVDEDMRNTLGRVEQLRVTSSQAGLLRLDIAAPGGDDLEALLQAWPAARDACVAQRGLSNLGAFASRVEAPASTGLVAGPSLPWPERLAQAAGARTMVRGQSLRGLHAPGADWQHLRAEELDVGDAELDDVDLSFATLVDCDFDAARLNRARLEGAQLDQVRLREIQGASMGLIGATLTHCFLQRAVLTGARSGGALWRGCHAVGIDAVGMDFEGALLEDIDFTGARLNGARFVRAVLRGCTLDGADLRDVDWTDATLERCSKKGART